MTRITTPTARTTCLVTSFAVLLLCAATAFAATPPNGTVSDGSPTVNWTGGPFAASNAGVCNGPDDPACDSFYLEIVPSASASSVVIIEMDSTGAVGQDDYDMVVYGPDGGEIDSSGSSGSFERVALFNPAAGVYRVEHVPFLIVPGSTYAASARLVDATPSALAVEAPASSQSIFATPTLMDSQLHTGEPSIAVSPVLPADGSRPLIVGDAPWGTSNATSLWWRSRDGGESYELVQDPLAVPRPRPCEEIDGGGDSDTAFDREGRIYVNDLAALINITVGVSDDDFQTMSCAKADGTNPLQPIQDRQWIAAAPDADGPGPNTDAYITFRRGLIGGNPVTETAIQIYATTDGGHTYDPVGEITDFFGFSNNKVSQTGNPVVDATNGPRRGTLYQAYYLSNTAKVGRYTPSTDSFETLTVAERFSDIGNVFPTLAIDDAGNLYYAWVEGGSFDVLFSASTDGGDSWTTPVRVSLPGDSDLAVNPYMVAGSEGRVAVLFNATADAPSPDAAHDRDWHLWISQSLDAHTANPSFTQYRVTDTPLHFNSICTGGLGCNLSTPPGDRSLLEFNEVDIDRTDGSMVFIFADNGRHVQAPLDPAADIPQPYIMSTRQIAGESMIAGKSVQNTLPRINFADDRAGDATYPKAGTTEGPNHSALDIRHSRLEATADGVRAVMTVDDLSDLASALDVRYGTGDPRLTQQVSWVTRFEVRHIVAGEPREEVYALGMELDLAASEPTYWFGTVGVARNALGDVKRSNYGSADGLPAVGSIDGNTITVEIPNSFMGLDPASTPTPVFHSVVAFALAQAESDLDGMPVASYFNNQRTVDASRAYDWTYGDALDNPPTADAGPDRVVKVRKRITFDGSGSTAGSSPIVSYDWDFGDGATASGERPTHRYGSPGTYTVTLTVTDENGLSHSDTATVRVTRRGGGGDDGSSDDDDFDDDGRSDDEDSDDDGDGVRDDDDSDDDNDGEPDLTDSDDDNDGLNDDVDLRGTHESQTADRWTLGAGESLDYAVDAGPGALLVLAIVEGQGVETLDVELLSPDGDSLAAAVATPGRLLLAGAPVADAVHTVRIRNAGPTAVTYDARVVARATR